MRKKDNRGGFRPGAGRKPINDARMERIQIAVTPRQLTTIKRIGQGNASAGARVAIDAYTTQEEK